MPLKVKCRCGTVLTVPTQRIGKSVRCPFCSETVLITRPKEQSRPKPTQKSESKKETPAIGPIPKPSAESTSSSTDAKSESKPKASKAPPKRSTVQSDQKSSLSQTEQGRSEQARTSSGPQRPSIVGKATSQQVAQQETPLTTEERKEAASQPSEMKDSTVASVNKPSDTPAKADTEKKPSKDSEQEADEQGKPVSSGEGKVAKPSQTVDRDDQKLQGQPKAVPVPRPENPEAKPQDDGSRPRQSLENAETKKTPSLATSATKEPGAASRDVSKSVPADTKIQKDQATKQTSKAPQVSATPKKPESKPAAAAKKLPPALKRESPSSSKERPKDQSQPASPARSERPLASDKRAQASAAKDKAAQPPPPLKAKQSPGNVKPIAQKADSVEAKGAPPLRKQPPDLGKKSRRGPEKSKGKAKVRRGKKKTSGQATDEPDEQTPVRGVEHDLAKRWSAYYLAMGVIFVAMFNMAPAFYERIQTLRLEEPPDMARWAYAALILGLVQLAYAFYLIQLPDWGSVWVVAILSLATTTMYAALASVVILGSRESNLLASLNLVLTEYGPRKKAILWCTIVLSLNAVLTYFCGRVGIRWHKAYSIAYPKATNPSSS